MSATENDFRSDVASVGYLDKPRLAAGFTGFRRDESGVAERNEPHPSEPATSGDHEEDAAPAETAAVREMWR